MWQVSARVERFVEPAVLLILREGSTHGYELADALGGLVAAERVDFGNLYRLLRYLEAEGIVTSEWQEDLPGPSKRTYELTEEGRSLLDGWAEALGTMEESIATFLRRYGERKAR